MADSKRQKIMDAVVARMGTILTANGYATDIGQSVHDWETNFQQDELPALSVCDLPARVAAKSDPRSNPQYSIWLMPIQVRIYAAKDDTPANIREMIKDVNRAIRQDDRFKVDNKGLLMESHPEEEGFIIPDDSFEVVGGVVQFEAMFKTGKFNSEE